MAIITLANAKNIIRKSGLQTDIIGDIYKKPIELFSKKETQSLLAIKELLENPSYFFDNYYLPIVPEDHFKYVFEGQQPAYHLFDNCESLLSDFHNFVIPEEIRSRGNEEIIRFRIWFVENSYLIDKPDVFEMRALAAFGIKINLKEVNYDNSGFTSFDDIDLSSLEQTIDKLLIKAGEYYYAEIKHQTILGNWVKGTGLAYFEPPIKNNNTIYSDGEIKLFLKDYDQRFKKPLKSLLIEYYRVKHNPEMTFEGELLGQLGFKLCYECMMNENAMSGYCEELEEKEYVEDYSNQIKYSFSDAPDDVKRIVEHYMDADEAFCSEFYLSGELEDGVVYTASSDLIYPNIKKQFVLKGGDCTYLKFMCNEWECTM